jgi:hypothetical protein
LEDTKLDHNQLQEGNEDLVKKFDVWVDGLFKSMELRILEQEFAWQVTPLWWCKIL